MMSGRQMINYQILQHSEYNFPIITDSGESGEMGKIK